MKDSGRKIKLVENNSKEWRDLTRMRFKVWSLKAIEEKPQTYFSSSDISN